MRVGLLHPGAMGSFIGRGVASAGHEVLWAGDGRTAASRDRAAGLTDVGRVEALAAASGVVLSVCPPEAALDVARSVAAAGFVGTYADLNAVSPATVLAVAEALGPGVTVVDGGIIGGPSSDDAVLHLAGSDAGRVAALFAPAAVRTQVLDGPVGSASALKACYAATTKAVSALLLASRAAARSAGVEDALLAEWDRTLPGQSGRTDRSLASVGAKAWRFGAEMREAGAFFASVGVPDGFSVAAGVVYDRLADLKARAYTRDEVLALISARDRPTEPS